MFGAIPLAVDERVVGDGHLWSGVDVALGARWKLALVASPVMLATLLVQPLLQLHGAEAGDVLPLVAGLAQVLHVLADVAIFHLAPTTLCLQHEILHLQVH